MTQDSCFKIKNNQISQKIEQHSLESLVIWMNQVMISSRRI